jgi:hypothetical protein
MRHVIGTLAVLLLVATAAHAQVRVVRHGDDRLTGISEVDVLVTGNTSLPRCAVSTPHVQQRAVDALRRANVTATRSDKGRSWYYSVVIDIHSAHTDDACATALTTELVAEVAGIPEADRDAPEGQWGSLLMGAMPLLSEKALVIAPDVEHDSAVQKMIAAQVAAIAARIRSANP